MPLFGAEAAVGAFTGVQVGDITRRRCAVIFGACYELKVREWIIVLFIFFAGLGKSTITIYINHYIDLITV